MSPANNDAVNFVNILDPSTIFRSYGVDKRRKNSLSQSPREHGG